MSAQVIIGAMILLSLFAGLFIAASRSVGVKETIIIISIASIVMAATSLGVFMIEKGFK